MNIIISPEMQRLIELHVKSGKFATPQDVVNAALHSLEQSQHPDDFEPGEWDKLITQGEQSGAPLDGAAVLSELRNLRTGRQSKTG